MSRVTMVGRLMAQVAAALERPRREGPIVIDEGSVWPSAALAEALDRLETAGEVSSAATIYSHGNALDRFKQGLKRLVEKAIGWRVRPPIERQREVNEMLIGALRAAERELEFVRRELDASTRAHDALTGELEVLRRRLARLESSSR